MDLEDILKSGESDSVEFKRTFGKEVSMFPTTLILWKKIPLRWIRC